MGDGILMALFVLAFPASYILAVVSSGWRPLIGGYGWKCLGCGKEETTHSGKPDWVSVATWMDEPVYGQYDHWTKKWEPRVSEETGIDYGEWSRSPCGEVIRSKLHTHEDEEHCPVCENRT